MVEQVFMLAQSGNIQQAAYYIPSDPSWEGKSERGGEEKKKERAAKRDALILAEPRASGDLIWRRLNNML